MADLFGDINNSVLGVLYFPPSRDFLGLYDDLVPRSFVEEERELDEYRGPDLIKPPGSIMWFGFCMPLLLLLQLQPAGTAAASGQSTSRGLSPPISKLVLALCDLFADARRTNKLIFYC